MDNRIYYFTGTGNSLAIARQLSKKLGADLVPVSKAVHSDSITGGTIGIVFPIYMFNAPRIVYDFLKKIGSCDYLYVVMTMGGQPGKTAERVKSILSAKGIMLSAAFNILMPDNYIVWYDAPDEELQKERFASAEEKLRQVVGIVAERQIHFDDERGLKTESNKANLLFALVPKWVKQAFCDAGLRFINRLDASFKVDKRCNGCGICAGVCPVGNIAMTDGKPLWRHHCEQCLACLQWCPQTAIEYGKKSIGKKRYHHPEVTLKEMMG